MKHEEKLKALEQEIRTKLPELMEVGRGCKIIYNGFLNEIDYSFINSSIFNFKNEILQVENCEFKVIGHQIELHHVLKWFNYIGEYYTFSCHGELIKEVNWKKGFTVFRDDTELTWNLDKPLNQQSEEMIDYLFNLVPQ